MLWLLETTKHYLPALRKRWWPKLFLVILFTCWFSASFAQDGIIMGKVKDGETVLQGATVVIAHKSSLTNSAGEFSNSVKAGTYTLIITHVGYKKSEQPIVVKAGETQRFEFNMVKGDQLGEVVVVGSRSLFKGVISIQLFR